MRYRLLIAVAVLILVAAVTVTVLSGCRSDSNGEAGNGPKYHCPMHPTVVSDEPGDCPICGMRLVPIEGGEQEEHADHEKEVQCHCPMHPTVVSDKPGDCPICGMRLVPIDEGMQGSASAEAPRKTKTMYRSTMNPNEISDKPGKDAMGMDMVPFEVTEDGEPVPEGLASVSITPAARERMGITIGTVERRNITREVRTSARIMVDETRLYNVTVKIEGWVDKLFVATTGQAVKEGDPLLSVYSPELVATEKEYLIAFQANQKLSTANNPDATRAGESLLAAARQRLELWDISPEQIDRLEKTGKVEEFLTLYAPFSGWVLERNVSAGSKIMPGENLLVLADLTNVWADSDIYQSDLSYVKIGMPVKLTLPFASDKTFKGEVFFVSPTLDPGTRTMKARMRIPNPDLLLKPEMYADARLLLPLGEKLVVPGSAVMRTGERTYAFLDDGAGKLTPIEISVGARSNGDFELVSGLKEGDRVVTSANFLVDSESSMKAAIEALSRK